MITPNQSFNIRTLAPTTPKSVPSPAEAIAPEPEAIDEQEILPSDEVFERQNSRLAEAFQYVNDLPDDFAKKQFIMPHVQAMLKTLDQPTLSANEVAKLLNFSHTRITRNFPNGTNLSYILEHRPSPRTVDVDKLLNRLSASAKADLLEKLSKQVESSMG